jgi:hypothetical protein
MTELRAGFAADRPRIAHTGDVEAAGGAQVQFLEGVRSHDHLTERGIHQSPFITQLGFLEGRSEAGVD